MGAGASPAPPPVALDIRNRARWPLPSSPAGTVERSSIGARFSPPTPPTTVLLAVGTMAVTTGWHCFILGRQDALLPAETLLWRKADERREREGGKSEAEGHGRAVLGRLHAGAARLAGGGNGVPLTSRRRRRTRPGRACPNRGRLQARVRRLRHQRRQSPLLPVLPWSRMLPQHQRGPAPATRGKSTCEL